MPSGVDVALVVVLCAVLSVLSYRLKLLTASGSVASFAIGMVIGLFGSVLWLAALIVFAVLGFVVTRYRLQVKIRKRVQEGARGERTYRNVLANGLVPAIIALLAWGTSTQGSLIASIVYIAALAEASSDTIASELGVLSKRTMLITTGQKVQPGTDGGVSAYGTMWALVGAIAASVVGWLFVLPGRSFDVYLLIPIVAGFAGCIVDSLIGATLERRGWINKLGNNIVSMAIAAILALLMALMLGA
jgi:uncharacterized protein (TIGR00297 family)